MVEIIALINGAIPVLKEGAEVIGWITGIFGLTLPFLGRSTTYKAGKFVGTIAKKVFLQKNTSHLQVTRRWTTTVADFVTGLKDGVR